jgi:hypothetical protein
MLDRTHSNHNLFLSECARPSSIPDFDKTPHELGEEDSIGPSFVQQLEEGYRNPVSSLREMIGEKKSQPAAFPNSVRLNFVTRETPRNLLDFDRVPLNFEAKLSTAPIFHTRFPISGKTIPRNQDATSTIGQKPSQSPLHQVVQGQGIMDPFVLA